MTVKERKHSWTNMNTKSLVRVVVPLTLKAAADVTERTFEGFAATWNQDLGNDIIKKGAFTDTLKQWKKSGEALPLLDSHDQWSILSAFGQMIDAQETSKGLWTKWEVLDGPDGDAVLNRLRPMKLAKRPIVGKMSIGFFPEEFSFEQPKGSTDPWDRIRIITKADLKEVSLVLFPMNPNASIDASTVKSFILSAEHTDKATMDVMTKKSLRRLAGIIGSLLKKTEEDEDEEREEQETKAKGKKPTPSKKADPDDVDEEDLEDDEDDIDDDDVDNDESVDDDDDVEDDEDTDEDSDEDESTDDEPGTGDKSANGKKPDKKDTPAGVPIYQYGEALQQRIQRLGLNQRLEDLNDDSQ